MEDVKFPESYTSTVNGVLQKTARGTNIYEVITYLRMAASCPTVFLKKFRKLPRHGFEDPKLKLVRSVLRISAVSHWLVFVEFEGTAKYLASVIREKPVFLITGQTPMFERDDIIESFRLSKEGVLVLTPVGGEGLDLQFCQGVINYDLHWNPMKIEQRIGRIDRIGQTKTDIEIVNIRVIDSIDDRVLRVIAKKLTLTEKSIFATGDIVLPKGGTLGTANPLQNRAVESELDESKRLLSALRYSDEIGQEDYELLNSVDLTYCITSNLKDAAVASPLKTVWLKPRDSSDRWRDNIETTAAQFLSTLQGYK